MGDTSRSQTILTKLQKIAEQASSHPGMVFTTLGQVTPGHVGDQAQDEEKESEAVFESFVGEETIETLKRVLDRNSDFMPAHAFLAASYSEIGWEEEARAEVAEVERLSPQALSEALRQRLPQ